MIYHSSLHISAAIHHGRVTENLYKNNFMYDPLYKMKISVRTSRNAEGWTLMLMLTLAVNKMRREFTGQVKRTEGTTVAQVVV